MTSEELNALPDSAFAYIEPGGTHDSTGRTVPRSLRHFPIHDPAHVRNALARVKESQFGAEALPAILEAAKHFGVHTERDQPRYSAKFDQPHSFGKSDRSGVDPAVGFTADNVPDRHFAENSIAGNPDLAGSPGLSGDAIPIDGDLPVAIAPGELRKYVPSAAMPITDDAISPNDATSLAAALCRSGGDASLAEICDLLVMVANNILRAPKLQNKKSAILAAGEEFKSALTRLAAEPDLAKRVALSHWRERAIGVERAIRKASYQQALAKALHQRNFIWPDGVIAIRLLGEDDHTVGWIGRSEFEKRGAALSAANRGRIHQARDILIGMCAGAGCEQDRGLKSHLNGQIGESSAAPGEGTSTTPWNDAASVEPGAELGKLLDHLRHATDRLGAVADDVRKVAEASASSIRKSEGSAKVLSVMGERIARLEAQPDNSRPQPLRAVEKGTPIALAGSAGDDIRARIAELQGQAAELRKRGDDAVAHKRLSEIGIEIIRLSNGLPQPAL